MEFGESQSSSTMSLEREWARFLKTVSKAKEVKLLLLNFFFFTPNPGNGLAFTGISRDLSEPSILPENIHTLREK